MEVESTNEGAAAATEVKESDEKLREKMIKFMADDAHMAKIKPEYLNIHYKARLMTQYLPESVKEELEQSLGDENGKDGQPAKKKAKLTGRNKKRPHQKYNDEKICLHVAMGKECPFGEKCRFLHDVEKYMASKPQDISETCYIFEQFGKCPQGMRCRFAGSHLAKDYSNIIDEEKVAKHREQTKNILPKDLQYHLRRREVFFPHADDYLKSIGIEPSRAYRATKNKSNNRTCAPSGEQTVNKTISITPGGADKTGDSIAEDSAVLPKDLAANENAKKTDVTAPSHVLDNQTSATSIGNNTVEKLETAVVADTSAGNQTPATSIGNNKVDKLETAVASKSVNIESTGATPIGCVTDEDFIKLRPGEKKTIDFRDKSYLAPLTTVGNLPFRRVCKNYGVDITCGEMALVTNILQGQQSEWALLKRHVSEDLFGVQLCGGHADSMTRCAELLNRTIDADFIDVNVGCPIDLIFKKGEGSALMGRHTKFEQIVRGMSSVLDIPLTVKIRTGIYNDKSVAHTVVPKLRDWGASLVTMHGRSREQRYTKPADWDYIAECAEAAKPMQFFGNGDILSYEDYNTRKAATGVSGVMIARGALIKPWIFTEIKEQKVWDISSSERLDMLRNFTNYGLEHWGSDTQGVETVRRFLLEWLSFLHRYIPVGVMEQLPQRINHRPPRYLGRNDLETLMASENCGDWVKISEMLLGPVRDDFTFLPKHKANAYK